MSTTKPFPISKQLVYEAFKAVKANAGAAGVDKQSIEDFEKDLKDNLYKIWNRMASGSYFPPPVKAVAIAEKEWRGAYAWGADRSGSRGPDGGQEDL